jgi:hypothetical protein
VRHRSAEKTTYEKIVSVLKSCTSSVQFNVLGRNESLSFFQGNSCDSIVSGGCVNGKRRSCVRFEPLTIAVLSSHSLLIPSLLFSLPVLFLSSIFLTMQNILFLKAKLKSKFSKKSFLTPLLGLHIVT